MNDADALAEIERKGAQFVFNAELSDSLLIPVRGATNFIVTFQKETKTFHLHVAHIKESKFSKESGLEFHKRVGLRHEDLETERASNLALFLKGPIIAGGAVAYRKDFAFFCGSCLANKFEGIPNWLFKGFLPAIKQAYPTFQLMVNTSINLSIRSLDRVAYFEQLKTKPGIDVEDALNAAPEKRPSSLPAIPPPMTAEEAAERFRAAMAEIGRRAKDARSN